MIKVEGTRFEYSENPISLPTLKPRLSWRITSDKEGTVQRAYRLQVARSAEFGDVMLDTDWVRSRQSQFVPWPGAPLDPMTRYYVRIAVQDNHGEESDWSEPGTVETARVGIPWASPFVAAPKTLASPEESRPVLLRREFELATPPDSARIYVTALGLYELWINGTRVGEDLFTPGWTAYQHRVAYQTYDVSELLRAGSNAIGAVLGYGWYAGDLTWMDLRNIYGDRPALSLVLVDSSVTNGAAGATNQASGPRRLLDTTPEGWRVSSGPILYSEIYHGERYDARQETPGWAEAEFDASDWVAAEEIAAPDTEVVAQDGPAVRRQEILSPVRVFTTPAGERVIDFGQNLTGWVRFLPKGREGERVHLSHAEILDAEGNFYTENLRSARCEVEYILGAQDGEGQRGFEPHFTFQGFRYVRLDELPDAMTSEIADRFEAVVIHSEMPKTLEFSCSDERINQLHHNILWGWKGNALDIPTDCPQRDERLGWTGDAQVFIGTATYLMQVGEFFTKWLRDLQLEQLEDGGVPFVVPNVLTTVAELDPKVDHSHSSTGWGDASVICPWTVAARYADRRILDEQWATIMGWIGYMREHAQDGVLWNSGFHFGDWVALDAKEGSFFGATPNDLTATAYYAHSVDLAAQIAEKLGKEAEVEELRSLHTEIVRAFQREFYTPAGRLAARTQTAHLLALAFDLVPEVHRERTVTDLIATIRENGDHLVTGFLGTPLLLPVLAENGHLEEAYRLLLREEYPSWLFQVKQRATTIWEHWDGMKPDGSMWSPEMNSFNHYAYGAVGEFIYRMVGGLDLNGSDVEAGKFRIAPRPGGGIEHAETRYDSVYGPILVAWRIEAGRFELNVTLPPNTSGEIDLRRVAEGGEAEGVVAGTHRRSLQLAR